MVSFAAWIKNALARLQLETEEWSRRRIEENAIANLERERIRNTLLLGATKPDRTSRKNPQDLTAPPMTDFFLRE